MAMQPVAFRALDAQVVAGRADEIAVIDRVGTLTYAQLLHESAVIAGAWRILGLEAGDHFGIETAGRERVIAVMAALRLQLLPGTSSSLLLGHPPIAHIAEEKIDWKSLVGIGRTDPLPAPVHDIDGVERWLDEHRDLMVLLDGGTLEIPDPSAL